MPVIDVIRPFTTPYVPSKRNLTYKLVLALGTHLPFNEKLKVGLKTLKGKERPDDRILRSTHLVCNLLDPVTKIVHRQLVRKDRIVFPDGCVLADNPFKNSQPKE